MAAPELGQGLGQFLPLLRQGLTGQPDQPLGELIGAQREAILAARLVQKSVGGEVVGTAWEQGDLVVCKDADPMITNGTDCYP